MGTRCIARAIGLSDTKTRAGTKKVRKLVGPNLDELHYNRRRKSSPYWIPKPVLVKVRALRDVQGARLSKIQPSLLKSERKTTAQIFFVTVGFLLKSVIVITLLYWVFVDGSLPFLPDINRIDVPSLEDLKYSCIQKYNHAVLKMIGGLVGAPQRIHQTFMSIVGRLEKTFVTEADREMSSFHRLVEDDQSSD